MKIILFIPYFGKLPPYFPAFVHSCRHLDGDIDFQIFTNDGSIEKLELPRNIRFEIWNFSRIVDLIKQKFNTHLFSPYKLCDYKPTYGLLFEEYTKGYEYWGYCDIDVMLGDIVGYLNSIDYQEYDRIGQMGHFTIYRNTDRMRDLFYEKEIGMKALSDFSYVTHTTFPCNFDEVGMNMKCKALGIPFRDENSVLNTSWGYKHLHSWDYRNTFQLWAWENGHVFSYSFDSDKQIVKEEKSYLHFMMHRLTILSDLTETLLITHRGIYRFDTNNVKSLLLEEGVCDTEAEHKAVLAYLRKKNLKSIIPSIYNEFRFCGFNSFSSIARRSVNWIASW